MVRVAVAWRCDGRRTLSGFARAEVDGGKGRVIGLGKKPRGWEVAVA